MFQIAEEVPPESEQVSESADQPLMAICVATVVGKHAPKHCSSKVPFKANSMLILVDFISSHTFLSATLAQTCTGNSPLPFPVSVQVG